MGKITRRNSTDREETAKPRKRRKKDLDRIHSKILLARRKLDNEVKAGQKKQNRTKICNRLLPEPTAGIYRNGAKGKDIQKVETSENIFHKARLKADALKLFNGDTHGSKYIVEIPTHKTTKHSPNKDEERSIKNSLMWTPLEQSPVLKRKPTQNQKLCLVKKKDEEKIFKNINFNKIKENVNDESKHVQKEDTCKRRLFQNDREQLETVVTPSNTQISNDTAFAKENKTNEKETEQVCSKNSKDSSCKSPLSRYTEFCRIISAKNFETDILPNYDLDPVPTTIKKLRHTYANAFRQQLLRKRNKQKLENVNSEEFQACTFSEDSLELSPVKFEVPKCSENHTIAVSRQEGLSQKNEKFHLMQNADLRKNNGISRYDSTSCSSRNTFTMYNTNGPVMENYENNDTQRSKELKNIHPVSKSVNFYFMKDKDAIQLDSHKNSKDVDHPSESNQYDKDNFSINISDYGNSQCIDNSKSLGTSIYLNSSRVPKRHFSKDYSEKLPIAVSSTCAPNNQKYNNRATNKDSVKNVKRIPTILRRYGNVTNNNLNHSVQLGDYTEDLYEKCGSILFNRIPSNSIEKELYEATFPNVLKNLSATSTMKANTMHTILDQTKVLEPQIESINIKKSQEFEAEQFDINMHSNDGRNKFYQCDDSLYPRNLETFDNTNAYSDKLLQQEQITPEVRKYLSHSNNYRPIKNYLQNVSFSNANVESTKELPQQTKLHVCKINKQPLCRRNTRNRHQNILYNNVNKALPTPILNLPKNIQSEKRSSESLRLFDKTDVECTKNQINQNACRCNEQYIYLDSTNCQHKYKEQAHCLKETAQSESLCNTRSHNNSTDNCVNLSSTVRNVPLLSSLKQENLYQYPKATDVQPRTVLLQNVTQPVKYLAVTNGSDIQRIPVYINDRDVRVTENVPLKVITLMNPNTQIKAFRQQIATKVIPLQTDSLHFNDLATHKISDQSIVKHSDSINAIVINPDTQSNVWYTSNL